MADQQSLEGLLAKAQQLLTHIEAITLYVTRRMRLVLRQVIGGMQVEIEEYDFERMKALFADPTVRINIHDIESSLDHYRELIPAQPAFQAALAHVLGQKYPFKQNDIPNLSRVLALDSQPVQAAYGQLFGGPIDNFYATASVPDERPFWMQLPGTMLQEIMPDLARELEWIYLPSGQVLFEQGAIGTDVYFVVSGRIAISGVNEKGEEVVRLERGRGALLGEIGMLSESHVRTATVLAIRDTELAKLTREGFERLAIKHPRLGLAITNLIVNSFREAVSHDRRQSRLTTLVVMPADARMPIDHFVQQLERALSRFGSVFVLDSQRFDHYLGPGAAQLPGDDERAGSLMVWLTDLELAQRFVLFQTDPELTEWTRRCLRIADRTLVVADAEGVHEPSLLERQLEGLQNAQTASGSELVLLQTGRKFGTKEAGRWLAARHVSRHHHLRLGSEQDFNRLARLFAGRAIGLAFSGGGARGVAHVGVVRAIQEAGIPVDTVGATSFGAIIGAAVAMEWDWQALYDKVKWFIEHRGKYFRPALPFVSLMESRNLVRFFQETYADLNIEDLRWPFFSVASNLTKSRLEVIDRGPVWLAVRASMALPAVFPPVLRNGDILVDGGVTNNLPADLVKERIEGGFVLASDTTVEEADSYNYPNDMTSWQMLWARVNPAAQSHRLPGIPKVVSETMALASRWQRSIQLASTDVHIHVPVERYGMFDYDAHQELFRLGYETAMHALEAWDVSEQLDF